LLVYFVSSILSSSLTSFLVFLQGVDAGGIAGRGVLVDWVKWYEDTKGNTPPSANSSSAISLDDVKNCLAHQNTTLQPGDILLVRTGFVKWHNGASENERKAQQQSSSAVGLEQTEEMIAWLWDQHFR
jgi:hypothetical protein